jgi:hypothetical protein
MRRLLPFTLLLLLATSCPRKAATLEVAPAAPTASGDPRAELLAAVERIAQRHHFTEFTLDGLNCTRSWRRPVLAGRGAGYDALLCAQYKLAGPVRVRVYDVVPANRAWTAPTDSLRLELVDSLGQWGNLKVSDR